MGLEEICAYSVFPTTHIFMFSKFLVYDIIIVQAILLKIYNKRCWPQQQEWYVFGGTYDDCKENMKKRKHAIEGIVAEKYWSTVCPFRLK